MISDQILNDVRDLVEELPDDQKQVVNMRHFMGLSFKK
jgi:RNA polymerase sigma-70 factor (ECF subfamily)